MDNEITILSQKLVTQPRKKSESFCEAFSYEPTNIEESPLGNLYIVGEIIEPDDSSRHLINTLASIIKREYYLKTKRSPLASLETALHKANQTLTELAQKGELGWLGKLNIVVTALTQTTLHATQAGQGRIYLWRQGSIIELSKRFDNAEKRLHPAKTFRNVASGKILENDRILFITTNINENFNDQEIGVTLSQNASSASFDLEKKLLSKKPGTGLALSVIQISQDQLPQVQTSVEYVNEASLNEKLPLEFDLPIKINAYGTSKSFAEKSNKETTLKNVLNSFILKIKKIGQFRSIIIQKLRREKNEPSLKMKYYGKQENTSKITAIIADTKVKIFIVAMLLIAVIFSAITYKNNQTTRFQAYASAIATLSSRQIDIESAIIIGDRARANRLINEAQNALRELEKNSDKKNEIAGLLNELEKQFYDLNKIAMPTLNLIATLNPAGFDFNPKAIILNNNDLEVFSTSANFIYKYSLSGKEGQYNFSPIDHEISWNEIINAKNKIYFIGNEEIGIYDIANNIYSTSSKFINLENAKSKTSDGNAIYALINDQDKITKCIVGKNTCQSTSKAWAEIVDASSIAIDNDLFIVSNANLYKLTSTRKIDLSIDFAPKLSDKSKIKIAPESKNIYIADPINMRIAVLSAQGKLIKQYENENLSNIDDIVILPGEKEIIILANKKIWQLPLDN